MRTATPCTALLVSALLALVGCGDEASSAPIDTADESRPHTHLADGGIAYLDDAGTSSAPSGLVPAPGTVLGAFKWELPRGFPLPVVPLDNPMSIEKVELGRFLFYDKRLSDNQTFACATCHKQNMAFADERAVGFGSTGQSHRRGSMSLANVAYASTLTWANATPAGQNLENQASVPVLGDNPVELGIRDIAQLEARIRAVPRYVELFKQAFPTEQEPVTFLNVKRAIATFQRTLLSGNSPYDRWQAGDEGAISESAKRGYLLFNSEKVECFHCHQGFNFTDHVTWQGQAFVAKPYHNTGLYNLDGNGAYPANNPGLLETTTDPRDMGKFKAPTLRNIARTAPYMHDGSIATLPEVIDHYAKGGRARSSKTDPLLVGFKLTPEERADLLAFLESLTDEQFLTNPKLADPGPVEAAKP